MMGSQKGASLYVTQSEAQPLLGTGNNDSANDLAPTGDDLCGAEDLYGVERPSI
jgi:hypothetical protein